MFVAKNGYSLMIVVFLLAAIATILAYFIHITTDDVPEAQPISTIKSSPAIEPSQPVQQPHGNAVATDNQSLPVPAQKLKKAMLERDSIDSIDQEIAKAQQTIDELDQQLGLSSVAYQVGEGDEQGDVQRRIERLRQHLNRHGNN